MDGDTDDRLIILLPKDTVVVARCGIATGEVDVMPDGPVRFEFPNISENAEIVEMMVSALAMQAEGAKVFATDVNEAALTELEGGGLTAFKLDVMDSASIADVLTRTGAVDVLFNCVCD